MSLEKMGGPSPEDMGAETKAGRPTEADFANKIEGYLFPLQHGMRGQYDSIKRELEYMAEGDEEDPNVREQYYPGWTDEDFQEVLKRLNEAEEKNPAEKGSVPPEPNEDKPRFVVGAKKNPDGTWDYSRAMEMKDPEGKLAKGVEEMKKREKEARAKRLEIPEDVKPGSANMAWYTMRNTIIVNEEAANKARKEGKPDEPREALIKTQKMQQTMFDDASMKFSQDLIKEGLDTGQSVTAEQARERAANLTANEMYDLVQKYVIDHYESLEDEGSEEATLYEGALGNNHYPIKDLLKAARNLQSRLIDEASRGGKN